MVSLKWKLSSDLCGPVLCHVINQSSLLQIFIWRKFDKYKSPNWFSGVTISSTFPFCFLDPSREWILWVFVTPDLSCLTTIWSKYSFEDIKFLMGRLPLNSFVAFMLPSLYKLPLPFLLSLSDQYISCYELLQSLCVFSNLPKPASSNAVVFQLRCCADKTSWAEQDKGATATLTPRWGCRPDCREKQTVAQTGFDLILVVGWGLFNSCKNMLPSQNKCHSL